ncbi:major facilitator superfamily domain-containing protein [Pseudomassariella vexata]|uniref:Major facilitator superfamily domain-containing protein n=1 Tax=Pseudomassariella vexata TaxID=1141098 RepID=A0A1Y2DZ57_9PEZI|nr:major facilitator superfamily domain-containing protein [Pseudomassariella vexata]ORY64386.1 major facilitator superfamily domain-containing protein [Pseudomassariella vexata]
MQTEEPKVGHEQPSSKELPSNQVVNESRGESSGDVEKYQPTPLSSNITLICCYLANFSDGFQNQMANPTNVILGHVLGKDYSKGMKTRISNSLLVGIILGTVVLGHTSDMYSRKASLLLTSGLVVGGEYPASAAAGLEESDDVRSMFVSFTTLMATTGAPACLFVYLMSLIASGYDVTVALHAVYSVATILPLLIMLMRVFMTDSKLFHNSNLKQTKRPVRVSLALLRRYWRRIFTTSLSFFLYDFINFPNSIMPSSLIASLVPNSSSQIRTTAIWQLILAVIVVPGPIVGAYLANTRLLGRPYTGMLGFLGYLVLGICFGHMGPGWTIGLISSEAFLTVVRSMGYSIADAAGNASTFYLLAGVAALGMGVYWFLPEGRDLDLEREDAELRGWLGEMGEKMM